MRKKIHKFPSKVLKQLLYKDTVIADGYYLQYIMNERVDDETSGEKRWYYLFKDVQEDKFYLTTYFEHDDTSGFFPFDGEGMIECRNVSIIGILKG